jgi:hypothetical protein
MRVSISVVVLAAAALAGCGEAAQQRRAEYLIMNPELPKEIRQAIKGKQIILGMARSDVEVSWGRPDDIEKVGGGDEAWIYRRKVYGSGWTSHTRTYRVVFLQGRVASFSEIARTR